MIEVRHLMILYRKAFGRQRRRYPVRRTVSNTPAGAPIPHAGIASGSPADTWRAIGEPAEQYRIPLGIRESLADQWLTSGAVVLITRGTNSANRLGPLGLCPS
jgi:hypothetical protein